MDSDLPITADTFSPLVRRFEVSEPGRDLIRIKQHFTIPDLTGLDLGREVRRKSAWVIYHKAGSWIYVGLSADYGEARPSKVAIFNEDHTAGEVYRRNRDVFLKGGLVSLTPLSKDQAILVPALANYNACIFHSAAASISDRGLLFVGHSGYGKSTMSRMLASSGRAEILCDERNVVRKWQDGFRVHGTWIHSDLQMASPKGSPLKAILFLKKSSRNCVTLLDDRSSVLHMLLECVIKPHTTSDWWQKAFGLMESIVREVPCYEVEFDLSGKIINELAALVRD